MKIRLSENFRALFYAPFYAIRALDLAAREGLEIEWLASSSPGSAIDGVKRGVIDVSWGGPMRVMKDHDSTPANGESLVCFGEVVGRDPFCLVGKPRSALFQLTELASLRLGVVSEVPTPWLCLQGDLADAGVDVAAMRSAENVRTGLTMEQQLGALARDELDVVQLFEPYISRALRQGGGILYAASSRGPTVYTTFMCSRDSAARLGGAFAALERAIRAMQGWMAANGPAELARVAAPFFPELPADLFQEAIERYWKAGLWSRTPEISRAGFARLEYSLHVGGFIAMPQSYESCVHSFT